MNKSRVLSFGLVVLLLLAMVSVIGCVPEGEEPAATTGFDWTLIVFLVFIFGLFYFLFIRPQRKRQKEHQQLVQELKRGDKVVTAGGIYARSR